MLTYAPIYAECGCESPERAASDQTAAMSFIRFAMVHANACNLAGGHGDLLSNQTCYWSVHGPDGRHVIGVR